MFTGLIQEIGTVVIIQRRGTNVLVGVKANLALPGTDLGDSIAIDGYCQTVVKLEKDIFFVQISPETISRTTAADLKTGQKVNLEPALRLSDRLAGHLVLGHVDGVGEISNIDDDGRFVVIKISAPDDIISLCVEKGSIAVDGISLTVNKVGKNHFEIGIIPHTLDKTTLGFKKVGSKVNLETDIMGKYAFRFLSSMMGKDGNPGDSNNEKIDLAFLAKHGFLK